MPDRNAVREAVKVAEDDVLHAGEVNVGAYPWPTIHAAAGAYAEGVEGLECEAHHQRGIKGQDHCQWAHLADALEHGIVRRKEDCRMVRVLICRIEEVRV